MPPSTVFILMIDAPLMGMDPASNLAEMQASQLQLEKAVAAAYGIPQALLETSPESSAANLKSALDLAAAARAARAGK